MSPATAFEIARGLLDLFFRLVPLQEDRAKLIDEAARRRALAIGEVADGAKFGPDR